MSDQQENVQIIKTLKEEIHNLKTLKKPLTGSHFPQDQSAEILQLKTQIESRNG